MKSPTINVSSLSRVAIYIGQHPATIRRVAAELGISPMWTINEIEHFDVADVELLANHLSRNEGTKNEN